MNIRRGLIRIWVVLTVLLPISLVIGVYLVWGDADRFDEVEVGDGYRFKISKGAFDELPALERYQVLKRIAWLNGKGRCRAVRDYDDGSLPIEMGISGFKAWGAAREENPAAAGMTANSKGDQPLSPKLESLARGEFIRPDLLSFLWGLTWLLPLAVVIPVLWIALYVGFWIASGFQSPPARIAGGAGGGT